MPGDGAVHRVSHRAPVRYRTGQIAPGGSATGDVCFDAPQGSPSGQYVVLLDPSFSSTAERVAWLDTL